MRSSYFTEEHELFRQSLRTFLEQEAAPYIDQWEEDRRVPRDIWKKMGDMGFLGLSYPTEYGGADLDFFYDVVFNEEIGRLNSGGFAITQQVVQYMSSPYILKFGSDQLKKKYLPGIIAGDLISSIGITEPGAGSDAQNIQTRAIREGDHYVVNGAKTFITNGVYGDFIVTVVKTDPEAGSAGVSLLIIEQSMEGVSIRKLNKLGWHSSDTAELNFDNVKVPVENLIGQEGMGFYYLMNGLQLERLCAVPACVSGMERALAMSMKYMSERKAFGRPISKFQVLRHKIAQMASEVEALKAFSYHCCQIYADQQYDVKLCSMAKLLATELAEKVATQCLQFYGGYGYMEEYPMARMYRDVRVGTIGGGSSEIMREIIAKIVIDEVNYD
jgi:alkylation response protein AidB-like acyl-CoA dehydrogenase